MRKQHPATGVVSVMKGHGGSRTAQVVHRFECRVLLAVPIGGVWWYAVDMEDVDA